MDNLDELSPEQIALIKEAFAQETPGRKSQRDREHSLLMSFKRAPGQETFAPLYQAFKPLIFTAAKTNMYGGPLPESAHMAYAAQSFLDSVRTWDPNKGSFRTHAFTTVMHKGKRLNLKYQNIGYIPEARATKWQLFNNTVALLRDSLGREPSSHEVADELRWSIKDVETMRKEVRRDLVLDEGYAESLSFAKSDKTLQAARDIMYSLIPQHQLVLEHALGLNGKVALTKPSGGADLNAISRSTGLTVPKIRSAFKTITRKLKTYRGETQVGAELEE